MMSLPQTQRVAMASIHLCGLTLKATIFLEMLHSPMYEAGSL